MAVAKYTQVAALVAAILASSMAFIDGTALNVALPSIQNSLNLTGAQLLWVVNGYTLFLASLMLAGGALGDIYGKKRVFGWGILAFLVTSLLCGLSPSGLILIVLRMFQGAAAALMVPGSLALISTVYSGKSRGTAIGYWSMFSAVTTVGGPVLGGWLADQGLWRGIFFINIPLGLIALFALYRFVDLPKPLGNGPKLDKKGIALSGLSLSLLVYAFLQGGEHGFDKWHLWLMAMLGISLFVVFIKHENKTYQPMIKLQLFKNKTFSAANAITFLIYGGLGVFIYYLPLNLIQMQGYTPQEAGIATIPFGGLIAVLAPLSGKWTDKVGPRLPLIIGPLLTGIGFFGFTLFAQTGGWEAFLTTFFPFLLITGIGMGLTVVPVTTAVMGCVSDSESGTASGINNTLSRLAGVILLAVVGMATLVVFESRVLAEVNVEELKPSALVSLKTEIAKYSGADAGNVQLEGIELQETFKAAFFQTYHIACYIAAGLCLLGAAFAFFFIPGRETQMR